MTKTLMLVLFSNFHVLQIIHLSEAASYPIALDIMAFPQLPFVFTAAVYG
jgi:hypothetical protein